MGEWSEGTWNYCSLRNTKAHIKDVFTSRAGKDMRENKQGAVLTTTLFLECCG